MCMFVGENGDLLVACFHNPLSISVTWAAMLIHGHDLCFCCGTVKAFLDVITECRANILEELLGIFPENNVVEG